MTVPLVVLLSRENDYQILQVTSAEIVLFVKKINIYEYSRLVLMVADCYFVRLPSNL